MNAEPANCTKESTSPLVGLRAKPKTWSALMISCKNIVHAKTIMGSFTMPARMNATAKLFMTKTAMTMFSARNAIQAQKHLK